MRQLLQIALSMVILSSLCFAKVPMKDKKNGNSSLAQKSPTQTIMADQYAEEHEESEKEYTKERESEGISYKIDQRQSKKKNKKTKEIMPRKMDLVLMNEQEPISLIVKKGKKIIAISQQIQNMWSSEIAELTNVKGRTLATIEMPSFWEYLLETLLIFYDGQNNMIGKIKKTFWNNVLSLKGVQYEILNQRDKVIGYFKSEGIFSKDFTIMDPSGNVYGEVKYKSNWLSNAKKAYTISIQEDNKIDRRIIALFPMVQEVISPSTSSSGKTRRKRRK